MMTSDDEEPPFDWSGFLDLAEHLAERGDEASQRTAVSRCYYAVFHTAQRVLDFHDPEFAPMRVSDSHKTVWDRLGALPLRQAKSAVRGGRSLLHQRKLADYDDGTEDWDRRTTDSIGMAKVAMRSLIDLLEHE